MGLFDASDVEKRYSATTVAQFTDDDGDGVADPCVTAELVEEVEALFASIVGQSFPTAAQREQMVALDPSLKGSLADLFMGLAGRRRSAFFNAAGETPYQRVYEKAEQRLERLAKGERRSLAEPTTGENPQFTSSTTRPRDEAFVFVTTRAHPRAGGGF